MREILGSGLSFKPHDQIKKAALGDFGSFYLQIAEHIWNPDDLLRGLSS